MSFKDVVISNLLLIIILLATGCLSKLSLSGEQMLGT